MSVFVEDFMEGIMADAELACYHDQFQDPYEMELLKEKLTQFFKWQMDGQKFYIGKNMPDVHRDLGITDELFDKACVVFANSLKKMKPKFKVMREFVKRIGGLRSQIVFPRKDNVDNGDQEIGDLRLTLFKALGQESGVKGIIETVFELASEDEIMIFKDEQIM